LLNRHEVTEPQTDGASSWGVSTCALLRLLVGAGLTGEGSMSMIRISSILESSKTPAAAPCCRKALTSAARSTATRCSWVSWFTAVRNLLSCELGRSQQWHATPQHHSLSVVRKAGLSRVDRPRTEGLLCWHSCSALLLLQKLAPPSADESVCPPARIWLGFHHPAACPP